MGIFAAVVPATALGYLQWIFAGQADSIKNLPLRATEFVGILAKEASEKELTIGGMGKDGMSLSQAQRPDGFLAGAGEAFNSFEFWPVVTCLSLGAQLLRSDAGANGDIEDEAGHTGHLVSSSFVTKVELAAFGGVLVVKDPVGTWASGVDTLLRLLDEFSGSAVHSVRKDATFLVATTVVKEKPVFAKLR